MELSAVNGAAEPQVVFRGKKPKVYRRRVDGDKDVTNIADDDKMSEASEAEKEASDRGLPVSEILRLRNARKSRLRGVGFSKDSAGGSTVPESEESSLALMIQEEEQKAAGSSASDVVGKRFAPQTGLAGELVNRHMEEYIETELAKRHSLAPTSRHSTARPLSSASTAGVKPSTELLRRSKSENRALRGKIIEVDLGDEARNRNKAMTDVAKRRLRGETVEDEEQSGQSTKVRLGRDGKPWRPKNRRGSDDVKRDQLVEEVLRENRFDVYETPAVAEPTSPAVDDDCAADHRIAEQFRREFMDAMAQRHRKRRPAAPPGRPAPRNEDVLKGPKLGGSRNSRAAMRDLLLQEQKEARKAVRR